MPRRIEIYTTKVCPFCHAAKRFLQEKGVSFRDIDVTQDSKMRDDLVRMSGGRTTVPQIFADDENIGGYDELVAYYRCGKTLS